jgi:glycosyltransferase involved in cell wall biosynthesis
MKVLFFLRNFLPFTSGNGASVMTWAFAEQLIRDGHQVAICQFEFSLTGSWQWRADAESLMASHGIRVYKLMASREQNRNVFVRGTRRLMTTLRRPIFPRLEDFYASKTSPEEIHQLIQQEQPDILYAFEVAATAMLAPLQLKTPTVASIIDLPAEWLRFRRKYKPRRSNFGWAQQVLDMLAERKVAAQSLECLAHCHLVIEHAAHHACWLRHNGIRCKYLPNPIQDPSERGVQISERKLPSPGGRIQVGMMGAMRGLATIAGLKFFVDRLLPALTVSDREKFEFHIFGSGEPPKAILRRLEADPNVKIRGYITDIDNEFLTSRFLLVPTPINLGFRTRIAEAFGYGSPVVAHVANSEGMPELKHGHNCLLCSEPKDFLAAFRHLASDGELVDHISINARDCFEKHYANSVVCRQMTDSMHEILSRETRSEVTSCSNPIN